ncbi:hypothetical protein ACFV0D_00250 [Streptomyces sp. NPDC059556]|uniref:hypothetical protein n=1 Tax=Streptomyces sp. NPDC059556 TaxID=3346863 RepID=UPI0036855A84
MPKNPPEWMQHHLRRRLKRHARACWPHLDAITVRFRAGFAYVAVEQPGEESLPLCRLRFTGVPHTWCFALYLPGNGSYRDDILPSGLPVGSPEEALDCAGGLYLNAPVSAVRVPAGLVVLVGPPASGNQLRSGTGRTSTDRRGCRGVQRRDPCGARRHLARGSGIRRAGCTDLRGR